MIKRLRRGGRPVVDQGRGGWVDGRRGARPTVERLESRRLLTAIQLKSGIASTTVTTKGTTTSYSADLSTMDGTGVSGSPYVSYTNSGHLGYTPPDYGTNLGLHFDYSFGLTGDPTSFSSSAPDLEFVVNPAPGEASGQYALIDLSLETTVGVTTIPDTDTEGHASSSVSVSYESAKGVKGTLDTGAVGGSPEGTTVTRDARFIVPFGAVIKLGCSDTTAGVAGDSQSTIAIDAFTAVNAIDATSLVVGSSVFGSSYSYFISRFLPQPTTVEVAWASGPSPGDIIGDPIVSQSTDTEGGTYGPFAIPESALKDQPDGANGIIEVVDPLDQIPELDESSKFQYVPYSNPKLVVKTTNTVDSGNTFGPYLVGVPFVPDFVATVTGEAANGVVVVTYSIDKHAAIAAADVGNGQWEIPLDVGSLGDGSHTLTVTTEGAGESLKANYTIEMQNSLNFDSLKTTYPGNPSGPVDATSLRYLHGISLDSDSGAAPIFIGDVSDLPWYYASKDVLPGVLVGNQQLLIDTIQPTSGTFGATFTFTYDGGDLQPGASKVALFTTTLSGGVGVRVAFGSQTLHAIALPTWLKNSSPSFDTTAGQYVIDLDYPAALQASLSSLLTVDADVLSDLAKAFLSQSASVGLGVNLEVTAKLTANPGDAVLSVKGWSVNATLFGNTLLDRRSTIPLDLIHIVHGTLDPKTLAAPDGIALTTAEFPISASNKPLFDHSFGTGSIPLQVPTPLLGAKASLSGDLQAFVSQLSVQAGLQLNTSGPSPQLVADGTFVKLKASGGVALALTVGAGITFLGVDVISMKAGAIVAAIAQVDAKMTFSGTTGGPIVAKLDTQKSKAGLTLAYGFDYDYAVGDGTPELHPDDYFHVQVPLFGLPAPPLPDFSTLDNILNGNGQAQSQGLPGVPPSVGQVMSILGSTAPESSPNVQAQGLAPAASSVRAADVPQPSSRLTIAAPVFAPLADLKFDGNVLSDHAKLTPGKHSLDVVLVGLDGSEVPLSHIDLAASSLSSNANPLGYATGWSTIDVPVDNGQLVPGLPYHLEFRLTTDAKSSGEAVAVALDNLRVTDLTPQVAISGPGGKASSDTIDFAPVVAGGSNVATLKLADTGLAPLHIATTEIVGTGFAIVAPPAGGYTIVPGDSIEVRVRLLDPTRPASATLQVASDDPARANERVSLTYAGPGTRNGPVLAAIASPTVRQESTVRFTAAATDPGHKIAYSLAPGAPAGATIDPVSGAFHWTATAPGRFPITVRATDDGSPPETASQTFTIVVLPATNPSAVSGSGAHDGSAILPAQRSSPPFATGIVGVGYNRRGLTSITIGFNEPLNRSSALNPSFYDVLRVLSLHKGHIFRKALHIRSISFDGNSQVTIHLARAYRGAVQILVRSGLVASDDASSQGSFSTVVTWPHAGRFHPKGLLALASEHGDRG